MGLIDRQTGKLDAGEVHAWSDPASDWADKPKRERFEIRGGENEVKAGLLFLVVDDDALSRDLLKLLLEMEEYAVEIAASGEAALARVASCAQDGSTVPDVILIDIQMPGLAGRALATALRSALSRNTLLLAMSGSQPATAALEGFDGFLLKPFQVSELKSMIRAAVPASDMKTPAIKPGEPVSEAELFSGPGPVALDEEIYERMAELIPAPQLGQMYTLCISDARKRISHMRAFAEAGDDAQYRSEAHAVKGGCGMIGAKELYTLAATAEDSGLSLAQANPGTTSVTTTITQLSLACDRLERILQERTRQ